jgi:hypothetical protein
VLTNVKVKNMDNIFHGYTVRKIELKKIN